MFSPLNDPQVEQWFARFSAPLKRLPAEERAELHAEVRQHLDALIAAHEELGSSYEEAWELALAQFGDPKQIGRQLAWESWRRRGWVSPDMAAVLYGLGMQIVATISVFAASVLGVFSLNKTLDSGLVTFLVSVLGVPIVSGIVVGRRRPHRAMAGSLNGALFWPVLPVITVFPLSAADPAKYVAAEVAVFAAWWLGLTCIAAYFASVTKRGWYRPTLADFKLTLPRRQRQISR